MFFKSQTLPLKIREARIGSKERRDVYRKRSDQASCKRKGQDREGISLLGLPQKVPKTRVGASTV